MQKKNCSLSTHHPSCTCYVLVYFSANPIIWTKHIYSNILARWKIVAKGNETNCVTLGDIILDAWLPSLQEVLLGVNVNKKTTWGKPQFQRHALKRVDTRLAILQFSMQEVYFMLKVHLFLIWLNLRRELSNNVLNITL